MTLTDAKILFTGATGQVGRPLAEALAAGNEVWCAARFSDPAVRGQLEGRGIHTVPWSMEAETLDGIDRDFTHVFHGAPYRGQPDCETAAQANAVATGRLMDHCRSAQAFVFVSTFAVYQRPPTPETPVAETDPLGGYAPYAPAYPVGKLAAEAVVRAFAAILGLRCTIARLNLCYGPAGWGGMPLEMFRRVAAGEPIYVPLDGSEFWSSPIGTDDIIGFVPALFDVASADPTIVNLAGDDAVTLREMVNELAQRASLEAEFVPDEAARAGFVSDNTRRRELLGHCVVDWRDGMARAVEAQIPGAFSGQAQSDAGGVSANIWGAR